MASQFTSLLSNVLEYWRGMAIAVVIALAATFVSTTYGGPQLLYALFFGIAFHFLSADERCRPGIEFCARTLLRTGVALLGARITFTKIASLGLAPILIVIAAVISTTLFGWLLGRRLGRPSTEGIISGGAVAICGASAALAISAVLPQNKENERFTLFAVVGVTGMSTIAMVTYPLLARLIGLDADGAGIFLGGTIHDVAQVVGAGYLMSAHTGDVATFVKLTRVACLVPVVLTLSIVYRTHAGTTEIDAPPLVPRFLIGFAWLVTVNSFGLIAPAGAEFLNSASRACLVVAIAALGVKTSLQSLGALGWQVVWMLLAETVWIALFVLFSLLLLRHFA